MYEFLAPWGALAPALSAAVTYYVVAELRRKDQLREFNLYEPPEWTTSLRATRPLSVMHG